MRTGLAPVWRQGGQLAPGGVCSNGGDRWGWKDSGANSSGNRPPNLASSQEVDNYQKLGANSSASLEADIYVYI